MGYADTTLASLQALTEYHFFTPDKDLKRATLQDLFSNFWNNGYKRIGDEGAKGNIVNKLIFNVILGWKNTNEEDLVNWREEDELERIKRKEISESPLNPLLFKKKETLSESWRLLEIFRAKNFWYSIRSVKYSEMDIDVRIDQFFNIFFSIYLNILRLKIFNLFYSIYQKNLLLK